MNIIKNKKFLVIIGTILVLIIMVLIYFLCFKGTKSNEETLKNSLKNMGSSFYENFYYDKIKSDESERKEFLKKYEELGIKVNLDNLSRYNNKENEELVKTFVNNKNNEACNLQDTKVIIYPKSPYNKTDYTIEVQLVCGFEQE